MSTFPSDEERLSPGFDAYAGLVDGIVDDIASRDGIPKKPLPAGLSEPNMPAPFVPTPIQVAGTAGTARAVAPAHAPATDEYRSLLDTNPGAREFLDKIVDSQAANLGLISTAEPIKRLPYKMEGVPATSNLPVESIGPTQGIVPQEQVDYQTQRRMASENAAIDADQLRAYLGKPSRQALEQQAYEKSQRTPGDVVSDVAGQFTMHYINMAGWGLPGAIVKAVGGEPIPEAKTGAGGIAGGAGSLLGLMGKVPAHVVRFLAEKKIGAGAIDTILAKGTGKQAEEAALRETSYAATSMGGGTGIRATRLGAEAEQLVGKAKVVAGKGGRLSAEGEIGGILGQTIDEVGAELPGAIKGVGSFTPFRAAGSAIDLASKAISKMVGFEAKSLPGKIFKNTIVNAATLGTAMGAVSWEGGDPWEILKNKLKAFGEGALTGAIFGVADFVPFEKAFPWIARIIRFGGTTAILDSIEGKSPLDDRPLFSKVFEYGLYGMFAWKGADAKGLLRDLPSEAKKFNEALAADVGKSEAFRKEKFPYLPDTTDKVAQLIAHEGYVVTPGGTAMPSKLAETKPGAETMNETVLKEQGIANEFYNSPPEGTTKQVNAEARKGMIDTLTQELTRTDLSPETKAEYESALNRLKATQAAPEPWPAKPTVPTPEGTGIEVPGADKHTVTIRPQADGSIQIDVPKPKAAAPASTATEPTPTEAPIKGRVYKNDETGERITFTGLTEDGKWVTYTGKEGGEKMISRDDFDSNYIPARKGKQKAVTPTPLPQEPAPAPVPAPRSPEPEVPGTPLPGKTVVAPEIVQPAPVAAPVSGPDLAHPKAGDVFQHSSGAVEKVKSFDGSLVKMENGRQVGIDAFKKIYSVPTKSEAPAPVDLSNIRGVGILLPDNTLVSGNKFPTHDLLMAQAVDTKGQSQDALLDGKSVFIDNGIVRNINGKTFTPTKVVDVGTFDAKSIKQPEPKTAPAPVEVERIVAPAVRRKSDGKIESSGDMSHPAIIARKFNDPKKAYGDEDVTYEQGYVTSTGRFVTAKDGLPIAEKSGQIGPGYREMMGDERLDSTDVRYPDVAPAPTEKAGAFTEKARPVAKEIPVAAKEYASPEDAATEKQKYEAVFEDAAKNRPNATIYLEPADVAEMDRLGIDISKHPNVQIKLDEPPPPPKKERVKRISVAEQKLRAMSGRPEDVYWRDRWKDIVQEEQRQADRAKAKATSTEPGIVEARAAKEELQDIKDSMPTFSEDKPPVVEVLPPGDVSMTKAEKAAKAAQEAKIEAGELKPLPEAHKIKRPEYEEPEAEPAPRDKEADRKAIFKLAGDNPKLFEEITGKFKRMADPGKAQTIWNEFIDGKFDATRGLTVGQWIDARARDLGAGGEHIDGVKKDLNRVRFDASKTSVTPEDIAQETIGGGNVEGRKTPEQLYEEKQLGEREGGAWQKFVEAGVAGSKKPERDRGILEQRVEEGKTLQSILDSPEGADLSSIQAVRAVVLRTLNRGMADPEAMEGLKTNARKIFDRLMALKGEGGFLGKATRRIDSDGYILKEDEFGNWVRDPSKPAPLPKTWKTDIERDFLNLLDKANTWTKTYMTSTRGMSPILAQFDDLRRNAAKAVLFHAGQDMTALNKLLKDMPEGWAKTEATKHVMDFLAGKYENTSVEQFPEEYRDILKTMRGRIDDLTKLFVATGAPTKNLRETMMKNLGTYLPEQYQIYNNKDYKADPVAMESLRQRLIKEFPDEYKNYTPDMWGNYFEGMIREARELKKGSWGSGGDEEISIEKRHLKHKDMDLWKEWKDFAKPIGDWRWMYKYTLTHLGEMAYNAQFLDTLAKSHPEMTADTQAEALKRWGNDQGWTPGSKLDDSARWGAMKGKFVSPQLKRFIEGEMDQTSKFMHNAAMDFMNRYITSPFKWTRTVGSVPSIMRNLLGAGAQSSLGGAFVLNPWNHKYYTEALDILTHRSGSRKADFGEMVKAGITEVQYVGNEIPKFSSYLMRKNPSEWGELANNAANSPAAERMVKGAGDTYKGVRYSIGRAGDFMGQLYNFGDQIYRVAAHLKNIKEYKMTPLESAMEVNMAFQNYRMLPIAVDWMRKFPVLGPFVSFKMNTLKIMGNQMMRAGREIAWGSGKTDLNPYHAEFSSVPESQRSDWSNASRQDVLARGIKRAAKVGIYLSLPSILSNVSQHMAGITNEERAAYEDAMPAYRKGNLLIYHRGRDGKITAFDPTFIIPGLDFPIKQMNIVYDSIFHNQKEKLSTMLSSMNIGESPLFDMYNLMKYGMDPTTQRMGREDVDPMHEEASRVGKALGYLLVPGTYGAVKKIAQAVGGKIDPYTKQPMSIPGAVINLGTGLKTFQVNIERDIAKNIASMQKEGMALTHDYQKGKLSKESWQRQIQYLKEQITKAKEALGQIYKQKQ